MAPTVFISYAGKDPHWPRETVRTLAIELERLGARVLLDQFHLERQAEPGNLPIAEWRDWMRAAVRDADRVICLVSARYAQAAERNIAEDWGYGVAYESQKLMSRLYQDKGLNFKRLLTLRPDGAPQAHVPEDWLDTCSHYQWPSELRTLLEHALIRRLTEAELNGQAGSQPVSSGTPAEAAATPGARDAGLQAGLSAQQSRARNLLGQQKGFFSALIRNKRGELLSVAPPDARAAPEPFVDWLAMASIDHAQEVMWAVRTALEDHAELRNDSQVQEAAVAVYMLCALRWVNGRPTLDGASAVTLPTLGRNVLAVLSAAFFDGCIEFIYEAGSATAQHVYNVSAPLGEAASINLLRAIYCELFRHDIKAIEIARCDNDDPKAIDEMLQRLESQLNEIRRRKLGITLVIDRAEPYQSAAWAGNLKLTPFVLDDKLGKTMFLLQPHKLDQEIQHLLHLIQLASSPAPAPQASPASTQRAPTTMPQSSHISVHLHGQNANLSFGNQSPITSQVQQTQAAVPLAELLSAIQSLKGELAKLPSAKARDKMAGELAVVEDSVTNKPADGKARIAGALEAIKNAGEAADGAEAVLDKLAKLKDLAAPILALLF